LKKKGKGEGKKAVGKRKKFPPVKGRPLLSLFGTKEEGVIKSVSVKRVRTFSWKFGKRKTKLTQFGGAKMIHVAVGTKTKKPDGEDESSRHACGEGAVITSCLNSA